MADSFKTLAQLLVVNDQNLADRNITEVLNDAPVIRTLAADSVPGTVHKYLREITAPTPGFRAVNTGRDNSKSDDEAITVTLEILDASFAIDKALADAYKDGPESMIALEASRHLRAAFFMAEQQILYGTGLDATGFGGLVDVLPFGGDMVVDAEGTSEGEVSQVFAVRTTGDLNNVLLVAGENAALDIGETIVQRIVEGTGSYPAYYTPISAWLALQVGSTMSAGRITNLTEESGKTLDDDMISDLLSRFPAARRATHLVMNRRSLRQLQQSRTATNAMGAPAPFPVESFGVPILLTDSVVSTGSVESAGS